MEYQKSAGVIVYYQDSKEEIKFLLLKYPSYWGFVKGIIEKDEAEEKTALRELEEETGIKQATLISGFKENQNWFFKLNNKLINKARKYGIHIKKALGIKPQDLKNF